MVKDEMIIKSVECKNVELEKSISNISAICDLVEDLVPGELPKRVLNMEKLHKLNMAGDVLYSKGGENGRYIAKFIFKTFTALANVLIRGEVSAEELEDLNKRHTRVLRSFVDSNKGYANSIVI